MGQASLDDIVSNQGPSAAPAAPTSVPTAALAPSSSGSARLDDIVSNQGPAQSSEPSLLSKTADAYKDANIGAVKGMGDTVSGVAHLIHQIPVVGETLAPQAGINALDTLDTATNTAQLVGKGAEMVGEFLIPGLAEEGGVTRAARLVALAQKYPIIAKTLTLATEHPWLAKIITEGAHGAVTGGVEGGVKGAQHNDATGGAVRGAEIGGATGAVSGAIQGGVTAVKSLKSNPFRQILEGKNIAQEPAEAAVRGGVQESTNVAGTASPTGVNVGIASNPILAGNQTILDEPLQLLQTNEKAAYGNVDKTVGFDLKDAKLQLKNDQYNLKQLGNTPADQAARTTLTQSINDTTARVAQAESKLKAAGIDPKAADAIHTARMAGEDFKKVLVKNTNPDGSMNIDPLLKQSKMLRFSKRGDRLAQFMGKDGADTFMDQLESAQKAGVHAMKVQKLAKWIGGLTLTGAATGLGMSAGAGHLATKAMSLLSPE